MRQSIFAALCATAVAAAVAAPLIQRAQSPMKRPAASVEDRGRIAGRAGSLQRGRTAAPVSRTSSAPPERVDNASAPLVLFGSQPRIPPVSFRLVGAIEDGGTGTPSVIVRIGDIQVPAAVSGDTFSADLVYVRSGGMVSVELSNTGVRHRALLGTAGYLKRQSGADRVLDVSENPSLRVSPLSTALHFFISRELGGRVPANDDEMDAALRSVLTDDIAPAANLLSRAARGQITLPDGFADGYGLLLDRQAYRTFLRTSTALGDANAYIRGVTGQAFAAADLERDWLLTGRMLLNRVSFTQPPVQMMLKTPSGYALHANSSRRNVAFTPALLANGDLQLTPNGVVSYDTSVLKQFGLNNSTVQTVERHTINSETYRRIFVGKRIGLWLNFSDETLTYPQYPERGAQAFTPIRYQLASEMREAVTPAQTSHLLGRRGFPYFCLQPSAVAGEPVVLGNCEFALHFFGANGVGVFENVGQKVDSAMNPVSVSGAGSVNWSLQSDGSLRVDGSDYSVRVWRLGITEGPADAMVFLATAQDGPVTLSLTGHTAIVDGNSPVAFSATDPVGSWKYGTFGDERAAYAYSTASPLQDNLFIRNADGTQTLSTFVDPADDVTGESILWNYRSGWKLINLNLYDTRYRANAPTPANTSFFSSCEAAFAAGANQCAPTRVRYFRPLARVGNRWYGIEDLYTRNFTSSYTPPFQFDRFSRAQLYERQ